MEVRIETNRSRWELVTTTGFTVINTDDYPLLKGKTTDELNEMDMDLMTLLLLRRDDDGRCLLSTMDYKIDGKKCTKKRYCDSEHYEDVRRKPEEWDTEISVMD
jgi:hypothetical protein